MNRRQWFASLFAAPVGRYCPRRAAEAGNRGWYLEPRPRYNLKQIERGLITRALREFNGNQTKAARALDMSRRLLGYKMKRYGIRAERAGSVGEKSGVQIGPFVQPN